MNDKIADNDNFEGFKNNVDNNQYRLNNEVNENSVDNQQIYDNSKSIDDEELLSIFVGHNYDKIKRNKFSIPAFFFGYLYFFFRKMYLHGFLLLIFMALLNLNVLSKYSILVSIILGLIANKIYLYYSMSSINYIKNNNSNSSFEEIKDICREEGGTNFRQTISLFVFIKMILPVILLVIINLFGPNPVISKLVDMFVYEEVMRFNGFYFYNVRVNINDEYSISFPKKAEVLSEESFLLEYILEDSPLQDRCTFKFFVVDGYDSAETLANSVVDFYFGSNTRVSFVNNIKWYNFDYVHPIIHENNYFSITDKNDNVYILQTQQYYLNGDSCLKYHNNIVSSIKSKN